MKKEEFAKFLEEPTREGLRYILQYQTGEQNELDFKLEWPTTGKLAKHILAFVNFGGGCLIVGVKEEETGLESVGLHSFKKKEDIFNEIDKFLPKDLMNQLTILDFEYKESEYPTLKNKKFQVLIINDYPQKIPFVSSRDGDGIKKDRIYTRRGIQSVEASYEEIQQIVNRRIDTGYSSTSEIELETHLTQLKTLYEEISPYTYYRQGGAFANLSHNISKHLYGAFGETVKKENPNYPTENYEQFINRIINKKKKKIELELDILNIED
ncbi:ATP-binding protein [Bacillus cereus]|uniref:Putative transcriptional regulator n=1 Tax=Bacillus cereus (strain 03BB102) TaxID=572264 RepID=A0A158RJG0_BACC3|nr:RNA-binding domain-containing protein [Bacillus cereus]ACO27279.1 putative transcriptional regulator [Bacillus cereus 03BB102]AJG54768.1 divergent AAA domain protein [Bacillus cereus 03BB102]QPR83154.1 putative DNA binding domain-containing protein [Bacillus cereus]